MSIAAIASSSHGSLSLFTKPYAILGVPLGFSGRRSETRYAPEVLRGRGMVDRLRIVQPSLVDRGDVVVPTLNEERRSADGVRNLEATAAALAQAYERVAAVYAEGLRPIIIGGEHSVSIASIAAARLALTRALGPTARLGVLWIDAHADINLPASSPSGNIHGMPIRVLIGEGPELLTGIGGPGPKLNLDSLVYLGVRDIDQGERDILRRERVEVHTMREIDLLGMAAICHRALEFLHENTDGFIVSFDIDVADPLIAPGVGSTVRGGLTYRESHLLMEEIAASPKLLSLEIVEYCPPLDVLGETGEFAIGLLESALGKRIL